MILFLKEFYQNRVVRNYIVIIFFIIFIIISSILVKDYFFKVINDNYKGSYLVIVSNNIPKIKNDNISEINRCIIDQDTLIIEDKNISGNSIHEEYKKKSIDNSIEINISKVSRNKFKTYEYENGYYLKIKDWMKINDTIEYLTDNDYEMEFNISKIISLSIENYYRYFDIFIMLIIIIGFVIFIISIVNIIIDEKAKHYLYSYLGYTNREILVIQLSRIFSLLIVIIILNEIIQMIIKSLLNIPRNVNYIVYISFVVLTIIIVLLDKIIVKIKK